LGALDQGQLEQVESELRRLDRPARLHDFNTLQDWTSQVTTISATAMANCSKNGTNSASRSWMCGMRDNSRRLLQQVHQVALNVSISQSSPRTHRRAESLPLTMPHSKSSKGPSSSGPYRIRDFVGSWRILVDSARPNPIQVKRRDQTERDQGLFYPQERTSALAFTVSALCHKRPFERW
jgi:hypothetical protein